MYQSFRLHLCKTGEVRETHEGEQNISKKLQFFSFPRLARLPRFSRLGKRNAKESNPTDIKTTTTLHFNTAYFFVHFPTFTALL